MATSLSRQLANLAVRPPGSVVAEKPSLLFPINEAKKVDDETIYNIAIEGFEELRKLDERFSPFSETLFSADSVKSNRESHNKEYNKVLDNHLSQYLRLVAPYFLLNPAHKTLEYLIRHYMYVLPTTQLIFIAVFPR